MRYVSWLLSRISFLYRLQVTGVCFGTAGVLIRTAKAFARRQCASCSMSALRSLVSTIFGKLEFEKKPKERRSLLWRFGGNGAIPATRMRACRELTFRIFQVCSDASDHNLCLLIAPP